MRILLRQIGITRSGATIEHLPPELLGIIFNYVHDDIQSSVEEFDASLAPSLDDSVAGTFDDAGKRATANDQHQELIRLARSSEFFPYNCARVSAKWRSILSSRPSFWTRVVFFIDSQPTSLSNAEERIRWSRNLPIDVIITYRPELRASSNEEQKQRIENLMEVLLPHIGRCRMLHIDAFSSTSLPSFQFQAGVYYKAPLLADISLSCELDDHNLSSDFDFTTHDDDENPLSDSTLEGLHFSCRSLKNVSIDGLTFRRACSNNMHWLHSQTHLEQLSIVESKFLPGSDFEDKIPNPDAHHLSLLRALDVMESVDSKLAYLRLHNFTFFIDACSFFPTYSYSLPLLHTLFLDNVSLSSTKELFRLCAFPSLAVLHLSGFKELDVAIFDNLSVHVAALFLSLINTDVDIAKFLGGWYGCGLCLIRCLWRSDILFHELAKSCEIAEGDPPPEGGKNFLCPNMSVIFLMVCPVFSVDSVKKLVEARNHYVDYEDEQWKTKTRFGPAIRTLVLKNMIWSARRLHEDDERWFRERLVDFTWE